MINQMFSPAHMVVVDVIRHCPGNTTFGSMNHVTACQKFCEDAQHTNYANMFYFQKHAFSIIPDVQLNTSGTLITDLMRGNEIF